MFYYIVFPFLIVFAYVHGQETTTPFDRARQEYICANSVLDLVFVLDSSASIWEPDFYRQITFVENIVKQFEIGPTYTQVGIVTFGQTYWLKFHLDRYNDKKSLLAAVKRVRYRPGSYTNTGDAIKFMNEEMFSPEHGDRFLSRNIAVVITDGRSQETNKTKEMAEAAHRRGIKMFAIGVGKKVSQEELRNIASDPNWEHVFEVDNYRALDSIKDTLTSRTCYELTTVGPPTTPSTPPHPKPVNTWDEDHRKIIHTTRWNRTITETKWTEEDERLRLIEEEKRQKELEEQRLRELEEQERLLREIEAENQRLRDLEIEKQKLRDIEAEKRRQAALEEENRRLLEAEQEKLRQLQEERLRQQLEDERRKQQELEEERRRQEAERQRLLNIDAERLRREQEAERLRREQEAERLRREQEERLRLQLEADRLRQQQEAERLRREHEAERRRKELEEMRRKFLFGNANRNQDNGFGVFGNRNDQTNKDKPDLTFVVPNPPDNLDLQRLLGRCNDKPADILFVMDASSSIGRHNYKKQKHFLVNMVRQFDIGPDKTRVGVIPFSNNYRLAVPLGSANDITSLTRAIQNVPYSRGGTHTASALKFVKNFGFAPGIARPNAAQIVIVLTDGYSRDPESTRRESKKLHDAGIYTFVIGIGNGIDMEELRNIASDPDDKHLFLVDDFNALDSIKDLLVSRACDTPVNSIVVCQTVGPMDITFMYDSLTLGGQRSDYISKFIFNVVDVFDQQSLDNIMVRRLLDVCPIDGQTALMSPRDFLRLRDQSFPGSFQLLQKFVNDIRNSNSEYRRGKPIGVTFLDSELEKVDTILPYIESLSDVKLFTIIIGPETQYNTARMSNVMQVPTYEALENMVRLFLRSFCTTVNDIDFNSPLM